MDFLSKTRHSVELLQAAVNPLEAQNRQQRLFFANGIERHALENKSFYWLTLAFNKL
jgi:hypothetical protein